MIEVGLRCSAGGVVGFVGDIAVYFLVGSSWCRIGEIPTNGRAWTGYLRGIASYL